MTTKKQIYSNRIKNSVFKKEENEYTIFNAERDNNGKGLDIKDLIKILEKLNS